MTTKNQVNVTRIVLIDDHRLFREGLKRILEMVDDFQVVDEGDDGKEVQGILRVHKPDVVLMDMSMPGMNGVEATRRLMTLSPETKVIVLSIHDDEQYVSHSIKSGASGYMLKEMDANALVTAVRVVTEGGSYIHPKVTHSLVNEFQRLANESADGTKMAYREVAYRQPVHILTKRECDVLQLLADGKNNRLIGDILYISEKTVKNHISSILQKIGVNDRTQAVIEAIKKGWVRVL